MNSNNSPAALMGEEKYCFQKFYTVPAIFLTTVLLVDYFLFSGVTITPLSCFMVLAIMAMVAPPRPMLFWAITFSVASIFVVYHPELFRPGKQNVKIGHLIHSISICLGAGVSVLLCRNRLRAQKKSECINLIVKKAPVPMILSDGNGDIIFINEQASDLLGVPVHEAEGNSFFLLAMGPDAKGLSISHYLRKIEGNEEVELASEIKPKYNPGVTLRGTTKLLGGTSDKYLLTILSLPATPTA